MSGAPPALRVGVDFGLTTTDAVAYRSLESEPLARVTRARPGPASEALLAELLEGLAIDRRPIASLAVTGGRSRSLPERVNGVPVVKIAEPEAIGRGGLRLSGLEHALIVSCGTGTAMILADERDPTAPSYRHITGTAVGGGTLLGLSTLLLGEGSAEALAALAATGDPSGVDTTLGEVLGGGVGTLPAEATAVNLGRLVDLPHPPNPADLAAGLMTMVAQVIALIAINAALRVGAPPLVAIGRLPTFARVRSTFDAVTELYAHPPLITPERGDEATALGAALAARAAGH